MKGGVAVALLVWIAMCIPGFAQSGGLQVFSQAAEMNFPQGYRVYSDDGKLLKTVTGRTSAKIQAKTIGKPFAVGEVYLCDWSFDRMQKGEKPNWIVPNAPSVAPTTPQASSPSAANGLLIYPSVKEVDFPEGYSVFTDDGQLIKSVPGPTSISLMGESGEKTFANGTAYLSDWSYEQIQQGKKPNWVVQSVITGGSPAELNFAGANKLRQIFGPQLLASAQKQPVDSSVNDDTKQRGMGVHGATVARLNSIESQTAVYPGAVEATFLLGYKTLDDSGMTVGVFRDHLPCV